LTGNGDCGSWVTGADGDWIGHIVAGKPETEVAYIVLAKDIIGDIHSQLNDCQVKMPSEVDFVSAIVTSVKSDLTTRPEFSSGPPQRPQRSDLAATSDSTFSPRMRLLQDHTPGRARSHSRYELEMEGRN
jgi:hypothetical protein